RCWAEIEDRVSDQLPWPVIRHVTTAIDVEASDPARRHLLFVQKDVIAGATAANGVGVRVLEQDQGVGDEAGATLVRDPVLQRPGLVVCNPTEPANVHVSPRRPARGPGWPRGRSCAPAGRTRHGGSRASAPRL